MKYSIETILSQLDTQPRMLALVTTTNGQLSIEETDDYRWIRDNHNAYYSILDKSVPERLVLPYLQSMMAALLFVPAPSSTLLLGAGGGSLMRFFKEAMSDNCVDAIDYDSNVINLTEKYFLSDISSDHSITKIEAMEYLTTASKDDFDLIFVDLFAHGTIPEFFNEVQFYEQCKNKSQSGVVIFNLIIDTDSSFKVIMKSLFTVFNNKCLCLTVPDYKNIIVLAFTDNFEIELDVAILRTRCKNFNSLYRFDFDNLLDVIIATNNCNNTKLQF